jgi:hypothetical protein
MMIAGSQGGKTVFGPWWLNREIQRRGGGDYIAVTSTYDLFKLKMLPEIRNVFEHVLRIGRYWAGDKVLELANPETGRFEAKRADDPMWGRIILRSAQAPSGLESATAKAAWLDEVGQDEFTLEAWEAILRRLALNRGRVLGTTTPYTVGWLKQQVYDRWAKGDPTYDVIQFESIVNPTFPREEFEERRRTMQAWRFNMFYRGQFGKPPSLIYGDFIDEYRQHGGHKVAPFPIPHWWSSYVGIDPGGVNTAKLWAAHDPDEDVYYLYRESLTGGMSTGEHAVEALKTASDNGERVQAWFIGQAAETQVRMDYEAASYEGMRMKNVKAPPSEFSSVESGIDRGISLLRSKRLFVFDTLAHWLDEVGRYRRKVDATGEVQEQIIEKAKFHMLDAYRYLAIGITNKERIDAPMMRAGRVKWR